MVNDRSNTAAAIFEAATRLMLEQGDGSLRVDAVATAAECNKRLIYHYFGNRDGLVAAVYQQHCRVLYSVQNELSESTRYFLDQQLQRLWPEFEPSVYPGAQGVIGKPGGKDRQQTLNRAIMLVVPLLLRGVAEVQADVGATSLAVVEWQKASTELIAALFAAERIAGADNTEEVSKRSRTTSKPRYRIASASRMVG